MGKGRKEGTVGEMDEGWGLWGKGRREGDYRENGLDVGTGERDAARGLWGTWIRGGDCGERGPAKGLWANGRGVGLGRKA